MKSLIIIAVVIIFIIAAFFDLKSKGLGYKLLPKPLKTIVDRLFRRKA